MKRLCVAVLCLLALFTVSAVADSEQSSYTTYGNNLVVSAEAAIPQAPIFEHKYITKAFMASDKAIMSAYNVELTGTHEDDEIQAVQHSFTGNGIEIYSSNSGNYFYQTENYMTYYTLLYYCIDSYDNFHPDWMINNTDELDFMTAEDAGKLIDNTISAVLADVHSCFDVQYDVYPVHTEDMRSKVTSILKEECHTEDDIAFFKRKHGLYEGCINDGDDCYFIEGRVYFNNLPMLVGSYSLSNLTVDGIRIRAIVNQDGLLYLEVTSAISISSEEQTEPIHPDCKTLITKAGNFLDNIIGLEPITIDKIELVYAPYPIALREYELVPILCLSSYDSENDAYVQRFLINALTGELFF